jgi:hypothetical protein
LEEDVRIAASAEGDDHGEPGAREAGAPGETPWSRPVARRLGLVRTLSNPSTTTTY